jgi:uncharacterized protein YegL
MSGDRMIENGEEQGQLVMPFYVICDVSYSMLHEMAALNRGVKQLRQSIVSEPVLDDVAQICVMTFSTEAKVIVSLGPMSEAEIPTMVAENLTDYGGAFRMLADTIETDRNRLREQGHRIYRPCAFFLTDGLPTDPDWHKSFVETLTYNQETREGMSAHPIFVPFGFRDAREEILRQLAYPPNRAKWYHAKSVAIEQVLGGLLNIIKKSIVSSGKSAGDGQPTIILPEPDPETGITIHDSGYDEDYIS